MSFCITDIPVVSFGFESVSLLDNESLVRQVTRHCAFCILLKESYKPQEHCVLLHSPQREFRISYLLEELYKYEKDSTVSSLSSLHRLLQCLALWPRIPQ